MQQILGKRKLLQFLQILLEQALFNNDNAGLNIVLVSLVLAGLVILQVVLQGLQMFGELPELQ